MSAAERRPDHDRLVVRCECGFQARGSQDVRARLNHKGSPSEAVARAYAWRPGTELTERVAAVH